jgi:hypothetical protein
MLLAAVEAQQVFQPPQWQEATEDFMVLVAVAVVAAVGLHLARAAMARKVLSL